jgi:very-short-patch-repair endonuclease
MIHAASHPGRVSMTRSTYSLEAKRAFAAEMRGRPTGAEYSLWQCLKGKQTGFVFHRQSVQRGYILDFYCPRLKLAIEIDGSVHELQWRSDAHREQALRARGITVIRFGNRETLDDTPRVVSQITAMARALTAGRNRIADGKRHPHEPL